MMQRSVRILLCSLIFGFCVTGCMLIAHRQVAPWEQAGTGQEASGEQAESSREEPAAQVAWWSLIYERPNPERLPVRIHFRWAKGLESAVENRYNMFIE